jgi:hypothetical protein
MMDEKFFESGGQKIDLDKITRIYPAALIHAGGESASVSLEWAELKADQISLETYLLVCDFDPVGEAPVNRIELRFETKQELFDAMEKISSLLKG